MFKKDNRATDKLQSMVEKAGISSTMVSFSQNDPEKFYVVALRNRKGALEFMKRVEDDYFTPDTKLNDLFELGPAIWGGMMYLIMGVPKAYENVVKKCALDLGMKVCDGVPILMQAGMKFSFPLCGPNVWTLENREK